MQNYQYNLIKIKREDQFWTVDTIVNTFTGNVNQIDHFLVEYFKRLEHESLFQFLKWAYDDKIITEKVKLEKFNKKNFKYDTNHPYDFIIRVKLIPIMNYVKYETEYYILEAIPRLILV